jgi:hypothetical protein
VTGPRLRADFNGLFGELLCLSHTDTALDDMGKPVILSAGMSATAFEEDADEQGHPDYLVASGIVERSPRWLRCNGSRWVLKIDRNGVRNEGKLPAEGTDLA